MEITSSGDAAAHVKNTTGDLAFERVHKECVEKLSDKRIMSCSPICARSFFLEQSLIYCTVSKSPHPVHLNSAFFQFKSNLCSIYDGNEIDKYYCKRKY